MVKYLCSNCGKEFKRKQHYTYHMNRKTPCFVDVNIEKSIDRENLTCKLCNTKYSRIDNLKSHVKNVCFNKNLNDVMKIVNISNININNGVITNNVMNVNMNP